MMASPSRQSTNCTADKTAYCCCVRTKNLDRLATAHLANILSHSPSKVAACQSRLVLDICCRFWSTAAERSVTMIHQSHPDNSGNLAGRSSDNCLNSDSSDSSAGRSSDNCLYLDNLDNLEQLEVRFLLYSLLQTVDHELKLGLQT